MPPTRHRGVEYDGLLFAYALSREWLALKLFRVIPLARVRLARVVYIRQRVWSDLGELVGHAVKRPFRSWYWPHPFFLGGAGRHAPYVIGTEQGTRIYIRLRTGFHYRLRDAVGRARIPEDLDAADRAAADASMGPAAASR